VIREVAMDTKTRDPLDVDETSSRDQILEALAHCCDTAKRMTARDCLSELNPAWGSTHNYLNWLLSLLGYPSLDDDLERGPHTCDHPTYPISRGDQWTCGDCATVWYAFGPHGADRLGWTTRRPG
jgi:hypothetical protein